MNASNAPDAQAAYKSMRSLWGAMTGQAGVFNHGAGGLEGRREALEDYVARRKHQILPGRAA